MKKIIAVALILVFLFSFAACEKGSNTPVTSQAQSDTSYGNAEGRTTVETVPGSTDLAITVLSDYLEEGLTQKDYDKMAAENGWTSAKVEKDGSVVFTMSEEKRQEKITEVKKSAQEAIDGILPDVKYPNFTKIETNDDFSKFIVHCSSTNIGMKEYHMVLSLYAQSGLYNSFTNTAGRVATVSFVDDATGDEIRSHGMVL